ncbi:unnamed protein product [Rotaria sp. Silwood1]|nr:unnamed protein product [Rotaria sp. Silwood1]CAF3455288.1 unnamed protein product [Rotaria sp. Silwood1]CAF4567065.1 unnamed protein product [Rotaria sp. Silwood1]
MTDDRLFYSLTESSLLDTYLLYGIIGLLIFIAFIGLIVLLTTSCCCFYSISSCYCSYPCRRHSSYKLNERFQKQENTKKNTFIKRHSSDITDFSHLYESYPHLINSKTMLTTKINNKNSDTSCTTIDTLINPISPCSSFRSLNQPISPVQIPVNNSSPLNIVKNNLSTTGVDSRPFAYIKNPNDCTQILRRLPQCDRSISPSVVSIDMTRISSFESDTNNQTNSPCTNIYETVIPITNNNLSSEQSTPIYETEWKHSLKQIMMSKIPTIEKNVISVIELPSLPSNLVSSNHYFQQQYLYEKFLANRTKTSDSMRRATMLKRLNDDAAFLY